MKLFKIGLVTVLSGLFLALAGITPAAATIPDPDDVFTFDGNLTETSGSAVVTAYGSTCTGSAPCNATSSFGTIDGDGYWQWSSTSARYGGGFSYNPSVDIGTSYTYFLKFQIITPSSSSYNKIVDYKNLVDDTGFYIYNDAINFYDLGTGTQTFDDGAVLDLAVVRDSSVTPATFSVYTRTSDGAFTHQLTVNDPNGESIPFLDGSSHSLLGFFNNDSLYDEGIQAGRVFDLQFWHNRALTESQLNQVFDTTVTPPATSSTPDPTLAATGTNGAGLLFGAMGFITVGATFFLIRRKA